MRQTSLDEGELSLTRSFRLIAVICLITSPSLADREISNLRDDLLGRWAQDCSRPSSNVNPYVEFSVRDGNLMRTAFTDHEISIYPVRTFTVEAGTINIAFGSNDDNVVTVLAKYDPGVSMQTINAFVDQSGQARKFGIKDGWQISNQQKSAIVYKCFKVVS